MTTSWIDRSKTLTFQIRDFIDGQWQSVDRDIDAAGFIEKHSPRDGRHLYRLGAGSVSQVERAVASARRAYEDGRWSKLPAQRRKSTLLKFAALIEQHLDELALLECLDVGKPISDALNIDVPTAVSVVRFCAEAADKYYGKVYAADQSSLSYQLRRPIGVVAGIVGWNFPLLLAATKIGSALAVGNSLVLKPSELTSLSVARVAEFAIEAGVPEGVFNVIHGGPEAGAMLAHHMDVDLLGFTGSTQTGKRLLIAAGQSNMKRLVLECGGKAPNIVFDDSPDLQAVADAVVARAFWSQGQVCTASSRLLLQASIRHRLLPMIIERVSALSVGDPLLPATQFGAVVSQSHKRKVLGYIDSGREEGAQILYQSNAADPVEGGSYVPFTIFGQVAAHQRIAREEIFGPVLSILSFDTEEGAIRLANETLYGLSAILWTQDMGRAHRVTQGIRAGWVTVNATGKPSDGPAAGVVHVSGHKSSGMGGEGGIEGLESYTSSTAVQYFV